MNITFVALNYTPSVGGAQNLVRELAEGLVGRGHSVQVLTTDSIGTPGSAGPGQVATRRETIGGVVVRRFGSLGPLGWLQLFARRLHRRLVLRRGGDAVEASIPPVLCGPASWSLGRAVHRAHRTSDVVVGCSAPFLTLVAPPYLRGGGKAADAVMPLLHLQADDPHPWVIGALRRADGTTASTGFERDRQVDLGIARDAVAVLPPGVDPDRFPDLTAPQARASLGLPERLTVGYIGRLARYKGIDTLLAASTLLWDRAPDLTVLVAGSPAGWEEFGATVDAATSVGGDRLVVRERFDDDEKALLLSACDVVVFPSREESFGMVTLEAWAARRPVVAADIGSVRSLIRQGIDGDLVPVGDHVALAEAVASLLAEPERRDAYGEAGRARVEADLSWPRIIDGWEVFLAETIERGRRRAGAVAEGR